MALCRLWAGQLRFHLRLPCLGFGARNRLLRPATLWVSTFNRLEIAASEFRRRLPCIRNIGRGLRHSRLAGSPGGDRGREVRRALRAWGRWFV